MYKNRDREMIYNKLYDVNEFDSIPYDKLTDRQKSLLDKDKIIF